MCSIAMDATVRKKRKMRFSSTEVSMLLQTVAADRDIISCKLANDWCSRNKKEAWERIAGAVSEADVTAPDRMVEEVKKKWNDLKNGAIRYKADVAGSGGGEPPKVPPYFDTVMDIIGDKKALLYGVTDTGSAPIPDCGGDVLDVRVVAKKEPVATSSSSNFICTIETPFISNEKTLHNANSITQDGTTETVPSSNRDAFKHKSEGMTGQRKRKMVAGRHGKTPKEDELWTTYLEEEIKTKRLEQEGIEEDIKF